jgi:hypothetical protein
LKRSISGWASNNTLGIWYPHAASRPLLPVKITTLPQDHTASKADLSTLPVNSTSGNTGMADIESLYKKENGRILIEIKLSSVAQLFNSFDPAPFHEKELDSAAEHYIVDMVKDFPPKTRFKMIIYLPPDIATTKAGDEYPPRDP